MRLTGKEASQSAGATFATAPLLLPVAKAAILALV